jgi:flavin reductase (DIM6/NTAB) family NADH-FMN oxidoreductase RutF
MTMSTENLRDVMRFWGTGVAIATTSNGNIRHGMTVNSFTSLALNPPLVMISLERNTRTHDLVSKIGTFGITILAADQQQISDRFAGRLGLEDERFNGVQTWTMETGSPLIVGGLAFFDCIVRERVPAGTHMVFIGEVLAATLSENAAERAPLMYFDRGYRNLKE